jgi:hypothetical protein
VVPDSRLFGHLPSLSHPLYSNVYNDWGSWVIPDPGGPFHCVAIRWMSAANLEPTWNEFRALAEELLENPLPSAEGTLSGTICECP